MLCLLKESKPSLAHALILAERRRSERLAGYLEGKRLRGLEQLFSYLEAAEKAYGETPAIAGAAFLVGRVRSDYQTALEATLSGYQAVASDAMRDVMEIECLLLDFAASPENLDEWLESDASLRRTKYWPVKVRTRLQSLGVEPFAHDDFEPIDYNAHSESLHVTPGQTVPVRGPDPLNDLLPFYGDIGFMEMFEHGRRVLRAIELLRGVAMESLDDYVPLAHRDEFDSAHSRTYEMQVMMIGFMEAPAVLRGRLGRESTTAERLQYVLEELETKCWPSGPGKEKSDD